MAINKVVYGDNTLVDLTEDSVTPETLLEGETAHDRSGQQITGTAKQGHIIWNKIKTALTQRVKLWFADAYVTDDSTNGATKVELIQKVDDISTPTADGIYVCDDGNDVPIGDIEDDYIRVEASSDTYRSFFNKLYALISPSRVKGGSYIEFDNLRFYFSSFNSGNNSYIFTASYAGTGNTAGGAEFSIYLLPSSSAYGITTLNTSGTTNSNKALDNLTDGVTATLYYGSSKSIINLLTSAKDCILSDGQTNVEAAMAKKSDLTSIEAFGVTNATGSTITSGTYFYLNGVLVRAKTSIASGAAFTLNTNYEVVTAGALNGLSKVKVQSGLEAYTGVSNDWSYKTITFETPYKTIPLVTVNAPGDTSSSTSHTMPMIDNISETGFRFGWYAKTGTFNVRWQAIGEI